MCLRAPSVPATLTAATTAAAATPTPVAAYDNAAAQTQGDLEARLRRWRSGAAADVLTGPRGIPATRPARPTTTTMGGVAQ